MDEKNYSIGLDIGTNSVGWAVLDDNNELCKFKGKHMWGSRLFDSGETAKTRRNFRSVRRRMNRRKNRIKLLQDLLSADIYTKDENFYRRLEESKLWDEDKSSVIRNNMNYSLLFNDISDKEYYSKYPTIYHLRNELIHTNEKIDIRFVYLALHHIIKYRGHFLYEGQDFSISNSLNNIINNLSCTLNNIYLDNDEDTNMKLANEIMDILSNEKNNSEKNDILVEVIMNYNDKNKKQAQSLTKLILGRKSNLNDLFLLDEPKEEIKSISFKTELDEDKLYENLNEKCDIILQLKEIYDWTVLKDILNGSNSISEAMIKKYDKHKNDLLKLKKLIKKYLPDKYKEFFRENSIYDKYVNNPKDMNYEDFIKNVNDYLNKMPKEDADVISILNDDNFMPKQTCVDNSSIPYQLNLIELKMIIENQSKYYKTLKDNADKIVSILTFKIPYYIGPLSTNSKWGWVSKKNNDKILPWNFDDVVDIDKSAEDFIQRMTNTCTYYIGKKVMPKMSLLYSEFCLLNELNKIKINGHFIKTEEKNLIINELFKKKKTVTDKTFKKTIKELNIATGNTGDIEVSGYQKEDGFASSLTSYIDFSNIFGDINGKENMIEEIIYWLTVFNERDIIKRKLQKYKNEITDQQINKILKLKYTEWSRLSKELLTEIYGKKKGSLAPINIIERMRETNNNFMEIINDKDLGFYYEVEKISKPKDIEKLEYSDINELQTSPANKKGIWQSILIVDEIVKIMGKEPQNICVEFARNDEESKRTESRQKKLNLLYETIKNETDDYNKYKETHNELKLKIKENNKIDNDRLFLYFIQNGKCLYCNAAVEIDNLSNYQIDHIIPQSIIKDDSIDNRALVCNECNQHKLDKLVLDADIRKKMMPTWVQLRKNNLISSKKFHNLERVNFDQKDIERFISRQLVETRQITKHVSNLLSARYKTTNIIPVKAELNSNFRKRCGFEKSREVNNFHHANDAYITIIVGKFINDKYKDLYLGNNNEKVYELYKHCTTKSDRKEKYGYVIYNLYKELNELCTENGLPFIEKMRKTLDYHDVILTKKLEESTGEFWNQTIYNRNKGNIRLKKDLECSKYGGYSGKQEAYYCAIEYKKNNKSCRQIVGIPVDTANRYKCENNAIVDYLISEGYENPRILLNNIKKYQTIMNNGILECIVSSSEIKNAKELYVSTKTHKIITKNINEITEDEFEYVYNELANKILAEYELYKNDGQKILDNKDKFMKLDGMEKMKIINAILSPLSFAGSRSDLSKIGCSSSFGRKGSQTLQLDNIIFINKSITGLYENKVNGKDL